MESLPSAPISITPQIANDLRTELFDQSQEIYYSWSNLSESHTRPNHVPVIAKPLKLTTWKHENAYKELLIPPPSSRVQEGQSFRLVLTTHAQGYPHVINLGSPDVGKRPHPVMSMPIQFSKGTKGKGTAYTGKQEHVERIYRIALGETEQQLMYIKEQTSFDLDKVGLADFALPYADHLCKRKCGTVA